MPRKPPICSLIMKEDGFLALVRMKWRRKYMRKRSYFFIALVLLLTGCGNGTKAEGIIEAEVQSYYSEVSGKIIELPVSLGQEVQKGDILAVIDSTDTEYALEQAKEVLKKAEGALSQLGEGAEPEQIKQSLNQVTIAEQNMETAKANHDRLLQQYENFQILLEEEVISRNEMEELSLQLTVAENAVETAEAQLDIAKQQAALLQKNTVSDSQIKMAEADVKQAENQIKQLTDTLDKYVIKADCDGRILSLSYTQGKMISAGSALLDISVAGKHYWVGYIPLEYIDYIQYNQKVTIQTKESEEMAVVSYIDIKSQYAPKDYMTGDNRNQETVKVKCILAEDSVLPVGKSADMIFEQ